MKIYRLASSLRVAPVVTGGRWPVSGGHASPSGVTLRDAAGALVMRPRFAAAPERPPVADSIVEANVRAISADFVPGHCMDHSDPEHLKRAVKAGLFENRPIYANHFTDPTRALGYISGGEWDETLLGANQKPGVNITATIDGDLSADTRVVARGVSQGYLSRWSLGFQADYSASHPDIMDGWDCDGWWRLLGTTAPDGTLFRLVCSEIVDVFELSVVDVGAIESARTLDEPALREPGRERQAAETRNAASRGRFVARPVRRQQEIPR